MGPAFAWLGRLEAPAGAGALELAVAEELRAHGEFSRIVVVAADASAAIGMQYIAPYAATSIAEFRSENWQRLRVLEGATENLRRHVAELASLRNHLRQEEVTAEMLEILASGGFYAA